MKIELRYGRGVVPVTVPEGLQCTIIRKGSSRPLADPHQAIERVFDAPIGAAPLETVARGKKSACILICDVTRPVPNHLFLQPLIRRLIGAGIPAEAITVLVATGLHRPNEGEELARLVGDPWVLETVRVVNHFARNDADHADLGRTRRRGTPVKVDRRFVEAELRIATGLVEPHFMAGYSGGRKVVAPGICHADVIRTFHSARFMEDPNVIECNLVDNALHEEQLEVVRMIGDILALNTVVNEERELIHVTFGAIVESHLAAVRFVEEFVRIPVPRRFKTVVTSSAGYPLDENYYQTVKGMVTPLSILEPGGTLIIASACPRGLGSEEFRASQRRLLAIGPDAFMKSILAKSMADIDEWQSEMYLKARRVGMIQLFTDGLSAEDRTLTGVEVIDDVDAAVRASVAASGDRAIAVIPEGPYVVPKYVAA
ncbi:MAG TPA: nickel-dependent lactate racemase [Stellaceae bacterium]|nr:nickel-dependent lactate racemase [Stellaceae bacterium]